MVSGGPGYCALLATGGVACWTAGDEAAVRLRGVGGAGTLTGVAEIVTNEQGSYCARLTAGGVDCWGDSGYGDLGAGFEGSSASPVAVNGISGTGTLSGVTALYPGYHAYCALVAGGASACWGYNNHGELGNGTTGPDGCATGESCALSPVAGLLTGIQALASIGDGGSGGAFCALLGGGMVDCWGWNIAVGGSYTTPLPVMDLSGLAPLTGVRSLVGSEPVNYGHDYGSFCAILVSGAVDCWRHGRAGELGNGSDATSGVVLIDQQAGLEADVPVAAAGLSGVASIVPGVYSYCAVLTAGGVDCWGFNADGDLGNGTTGPNSCVLGDCSTVPRPVRRVGGAGALATVTGAASDDTAYCAVHYSGVVDCWGHSDAGQLGNGHNDSSPVPVKVVAPA
jgi:alpha-tubulin suppressor-like RCC1 family protein